MSNCSTCKRRITRNRSLYLNSNICHECITKLNDRNYVVTTNGELLTSNCDNNVLDIPNDTLDINRKDDDLIIVDSISNEIRIAEETETPTVEIPIMNCLDDHKDALLASLYSQVMFLRQNIEEKNLLLRILILKETEVNNYVVINPCTTTLSRDINSIPTHISENGNDDTFVNGNETYPKETDSSTENADSDNEINEIPSFCDLHVQYEDFIQSEKVKKIERETNIANQLVQIRSMKHNEYIQIKKPAVDDMLINGESNRPNIDADNERNRRQCVPPKPPHHSKKAWNENTLLIVGDSILNGIQENRMSFNGSIKVRPFPGAVVNDFYNYLEPLMEKKPEKLIIHAGSNDALDKTAEEIFNDLIQLKSYIKQRFCIDAVISCPTMRTDNSRAKKVVVELCEYLNKLECTVICNDNITSECLGKGGW